jgi:hypothetical protein
VSGSPLDPVVHLFTTLALVFVSAAVITLSAVSFLRWMGLHWSWTAPGVLAGALLLPFDQHAAGFVVATSAFATATGARWHADDLRRGGDQAQDARDRRTMLDAPANAAAAAASAADAGSTAVAWPSGPTAAAARSASRPAVPAAGTRSSSAPPAP